MASKSPIFLAVALVASAIGAPAAAQSDADEDELRLHNEPHSYTNVIDALDGDDPFDVRATLNFTREWSTGQVQRERNAPNLATGRASSQYYPIATHEHLRNTLNVGLELGVFHDLEIYGLLPIVLSDTRELKSPESDADRNTSRDLLREDQPAGWGAGSEVQLFDVPFSAQQRSGVPHVNVGIAWGIFNQFRNNSLPTWLVMLEGQFALGSAMRPCSRDPGSGTDLPFENYNGVPAGGSPATSRCNGGDDPGLTDGVHWLKFETRSSYRLRYVEPYAGLQFQAGFPASASSNFKPGGDLEGYTNVMPPIQGELTAGVAVIPWEARARHQRLTVDVRVMGRYISEGHYYSPLFDALGTSTSAYLQTPNNETADGTGREVFFQGLTDVEPHGRLSARFAIEMQAAEYIRFVVGTRLGWETPYSLTYSDACNPNFSPEPGDPREGNCQGGIINPHHRANVDLPGRRFYLDDQFQFDLFASAIGQF